MKIILLISAVCLHLGGTCGSDDTDGVGAFAYQDSTGNRYGGTYGLREGQVVNPQGTFPPNFSPPTIPDLDDFFSEYFSNFENILQEAGFPFFFRPRPFRRLQRPFRRTFESNIENQKLAYDAARKAFDLTSNQAGYNPNFTPSRFPFGGGFPGAGGFGSPGFPGFPGGQFPAFPQFPDIPMSDFRSADTAYAGAFASDDIAHQIAHISPHNPTNPNIKVTKMTGSPGGFKSVSSSSSVSSGNFNGKPFSSRVAETLVNDGGVVTHYKVQS